jgi:SAM-dependent methyltransferase
MFLLSCRACGHSFIDPIPSPSDLLATYTAGYFEVHRRNRPQLSLVEKRRLGWLGRYAPPGRILEIGSGTGIFIEVASSAGWTVTGVEPSGPACEEARRMTGKEVIHGTMDAVPADSRFDAVAMWHVAEHLADPAGVLREAHGRMVPGGILAVESPDAGSIKARLRGKKWAYFTPPEHVQFFTGRSMRALMKRTGFEPLWIRGTSFTRLLGPLDAAGLSGMRNWISARAGKLAWIKRAAETAKGLVGLDDCLFMVARRVP